MKTHTPASSYFTHKNILIRQLYIRRRLLLSVFMAIFFFFLTPHFIELKSLTRLILSWDVGVVIYLVFGAFVIAFSSHEQMRVQARLHFYRSGADYSSGHCESWRFDRGACDGKRSRWND